MGGRRAKPWVTTLQRAPYFWAVYLEDDEAPFDTSIDVEFKGRAASVDYEEYDSRNLGRLRSRAEGTRPTRVLRVGYRRFRVREAPIAIQVAFSRQGVNYGLRQWVRVYREFSTRPWVIAGALFVPGARVELQSVTIDPIYPSDGGPPTLGRIAFKSVSRQAFASFVWRWPGVRGRVENISGAGKRLFISAVAPDITAAMGLPFGEQKIFCVGFSWPFLWDRVSFTLGWKIAKEERVAPGFALGQTVPIDADVTALRTADWRFSPKRVLVGLSFELVRSR